MAVLCAHAYSCITNIIHIGIFPYDVVAPTVFINGLNTTQVTAAAGDDVTFTCLAHGFPETTLNNQLLGVTASYTIGDQTLMTEATPTSFMEVTRTVTLHNVTVLDCGVVVTCVGSNMNSDGSTHTDQAVATLQVQGERGWSDLAPAPMHHSTFICPVYPIPPAIHCPAPPSVSVTPSETLLNVGDPLTLTCTGGDSVGTTTFNFSWLFDGSPVGTSRVMAINSTASQLSVTSVTSADFGTYTCQVTSVHGAGTAVAYARERREFPQQLSHCHWTTPLVMSHLCHWVRWSVPQSS